MYRVVEKLRRVNHTTFMVNSQHAYTYISTQYPNRVNWDMDKILMITIDIEVQCENGFPDPQKAYRTTIIYYNQKSSEQTYYGLGYR